MQMNIDQYCYMPSPLGNLLLAGHNDVLYLLGFPQGKMTYMPEANWQLVPNAFKQHRQQLSEYFANQRTTFDLPYVLIGTPFQTTVLEQVAAIPYAQTASYGAIANKINNPCAVRAVGTANARNPLPIIIPCHRVIGKDGSLTGFGGGLEAKAYLLELEAKSMCHL